MEIQSALNHAIRERREEILAFCRDLIGIASENPPGRRYRECAERIRREMEGLGLEVTMVEVPGFPEFPRWNLFGSYGEGTRTLCFHGHYDVVPAFRAEQFVPRMEDGWLHGRGAADMKAGLAVMIYAAGLLKQLRVPLAGRLVLCVVADEETGGRGGSGYLEQIGWPGPEVFAMITPEPTGGVVWHANRGAITLQINVHGKAAHVGLQHQGINAFEEMLRVAAALQRLKGEVETRITGYRIEPAEAARSILMLGGQVHGGTNFNVVPAGCSFTVDRRFNPEEDLEIEKDRLLELLDGLRHEGIDLEVEVLQEGCSGGVPEDHPVAGVLSDTIQELAGRRPAFEMCPGLLETRWYARRGIPAFAYGPGSLELAHGPAEAVEIEEIFRHTLLYALLATRLPG